MDGLAVLGEKWIVVLGALGVVSLGCSIVLFLSKASFKEKKQLRRSVLFTSIFFAASVFFRLAFLADIFVPPYFDSVEHYRIIKQLTTALEGSTLLETIPTLTPSYYHFGFHILASYLIFGLHADPMDVILVLGQVILAALPIPLYFLVRQEARSDAAAFFSMLLAGFGWYMPGFAVNWGKYPALVGLFALEIVLSIAYRLSRKHASRREQIVLVALLIFGIGASTLFHTRALVIIAISFASWRIAGTIKNFTNRFQLLSLGILLSVVMVIGIMVQKEPLLQASVDPYLGHGIWVTLIIVAVSPFAWLKFPRGVYFSILFTLFVLAALFMPVPAWLPALESQTLLDRPFVEMVLYLPLSILGGLGVAGFQQTSNSLTGARPDRTHSYTRASITILLASFAGLVLIGRYDFYPSDCCTFVEYGDTIVLDWIDRNLPLDARILVAVMQMNVLPSGPSAGFVGTDAGIWIPALTGRNISLAPFDSDFRSESTLDQLCQKQVDFIYLGSTTQKFNLSQLAAKPEWYQGLLFLPEVQLYRLTGCSR